MQRFVLTWLGLIIGLHCCSQNHFNHWNFGDYSSLDFSDISNVVSSQGHLLAEEGATSFSDAEGNLLFSTDGVSVFDRNGNPFPSGFNVRGGELSTQNAIVVPLLNDADERFYYLFTISPAQFPPENPGMYVTVIDMSLNDGLGDISEAPELIIPGTLEKIHASMHDNGRDVWVGTHKHGTNEFYFVPVTCDGVGEPIISTTEHFVDQNEMGFTADGMLKFSPDGSKVAMTWGNPNTALAHLQVCEFNSNTGDVTSIFTTTRQDFLLATGYGLEFSPNSDYLFWTYFTLSGSQLERFDLTVGDPVNSASVIVSTTSFFQVAALQLAPDNKIYVARPYAGDQGFISRIENPNEANPANIIFTPLAFELDELCRFGLSNNWNYVPLSAQDSIIEIKLCQDIDTLIDLSFYEADSYLWSDGSESSSKIIGVAGEYAVTLSFPCYILELVFAVEEVNHPDFSAPTELAICENDSIAVYIETTDELRWFDGSTTNPRTIKEPGLYNFTVGNEGCRLDDWVRIEEIEPPSITFSPDFLTICENQQITLMPKLNFVDSIQWSNGAISQFLAVESEGEYSLDAWNECGIESASVLVMQEECFCSIYFPNAFSPNADGINDLFRGVTDCDVQDFYLAIYDRWGQKVWETKSIFDGWLGGDSHYTQSGIYSYIYIAELRKNGLRFFREGQGHLSVVR